MYLLCFLNMGKPAKKWTPFPLPIDYFLYVNMHVNTTGNIEIKMKRGHFHILHDKHNYHDKPSVIYGGQ